VGTLEIRDVTIVIKGYCAKPRGAECPAKFCLDCPFFARDEVRVVKSEER